MTPARQEIQILMNSIATTARTNPLPHFDPEALATILIEEMEGVWSLMSIDSKIALSLIAVTLQHRKNGVVVQQAEPTSLARWWGKKDRT